MEATEVLDQPTATAEAENYTEFRAIRQAQKEAPKDEVPPARTEVSKSAQPLEPTATEGARITELSAETKREKERGDALQGELERLKAAPKPAAVPKQAAIAGDEDFIVEPRLKDFIAKLKPDESYEDGVQAHLKAWHQWHRAELNREQQVDSERQASETRKQTGARNLSDARKRYPDFDEKLKSYQTSQVMTDFFIDTPGGMDVARALADRPADVARILGHKTVAGQMSELAYIAQELKAAPKKPATQASRVPAPAKVLAGTAPPGARIPSEASSFSEHKRIRAGR